MNALCVEIARFGLVALTFVLGLGRTEAANYFVDRNHASASDSNSGTEASPWLTISKANSTLRAGDTVYIKAGTYNTQISPGSTGSPGQRITYRNFGNDNVTITETTAAVTLSGKSYITIEGIRFYRLDRFMSIERGTNNIIAYCTFDQVRNRSAWAGSTLRNHSQSNWIHHCTFSRYGVFTGDDIGAVIDIGAEEPSSPDLTHYNLIEDSTFAYGGHHVMGVFGMYNVIRNNYFHNESWPDFGNRNLYLSGIEGSSGRHLIEGNRVAFAGYPPDNNGSYGMHVLSRNNIIRGNSIYASTNNGILLSVTSSYLTSPSHNRIYQNTFFNNGWNPQADQQHSAGLGFAFYSGTRYVIGNVVKNNLFYRNPKSYGNYRVDFAQQTFSGNFEQTGDPLFVNAQTGTDPLNPSLPDLHLRSGSPCIDAGVSLTQITSASGSGRQFVVQDASYFMDGWGIIQGDLIRFHGTSQTARITALDYNANTVRVDRDVNWSQNQGVSLAYSGNAPDIGAFEFDGGSPPAKPVPPQNLRVIASAD